MTLSDTGGSPRVETPFGRDEQVALSVVIPSVNGLGDLLGCLDALAEQRGVGPIEVLLADRCGPAVCDVVRRRFPAVRILEAPPGASIPALRTMGFAAACAASVAVIEDHVIVPPDWARRLLDAQVAGSGVVGGAVENAATDRLVDWAAFLCEYSHCIPPLPAGSVQWLIGNNVIYPRELLEEHWDTIAGEQWENHLHDALRHAGVVLTCRPDIVVGHKKHFTVFEYLRQRYWYARSYAGARVVDASIARRLSYGVAALALPPLLGYRIVSRVLAKRRYRAELLRSIPLIALFVAAWAAGEAAGYTFGPGDSLRRVC